MKNPALLFLASLSAAACSTTPCTPVEVKVPVAVSCVQTVPERPAWAVDDLAEDAGDFDKVQALAVDYLQQRQYINSLEAVVEGCAAPEMPAVR